MVANTSPIFSRTPQVEWGNVTTANTAKDGTGTVVTVFTADATEGSYIERLKVRPQGTNTASVLRVFINILFDEIGLPGTTNTEVAAIAGLVVPMNLALPPGYKINITLGTTVAGGYAVTGVGGKY